MCWIPLSLLTALAAATQDAWVKRLSVIFGMLYGGLWFGERQLTVRMTGAGIMLAGAAAIMIGG